MFGRKKTTNETPWANLIEAPTKETYITPTDKEDATYMVGTLDDGRVQLRVGYPTSITLTMNDVAVRKLIKMLEAALDNEGDNSNG